MYMLINVKTMQRGYDRSVIGPFPTPEAAHEYRKENSLGDWLHIIPVSKP